MSLRSAAALSVLSGCVFAVPPPSFLAGVPLTADEADPGLEIDGAVGAVPAAAASWGVPLGERTSIELRGQVGRTHGVVTPGLWLRAPLSPEQRAWVAVRLGGALGTGALGTVLAFDNPYAGPTAHLQLAGLTGSGARAASVGLTLGAEMTSPIYGQNHPSVSTVDGFDLELVKGLWSQMSVRAEIPLSERSALALGIGAHGYGYLSSTLLAPQLEIGLSR